MEHWVLYYKILPNIYCRKYIFIYIYGEFNGYISSDTCYWLRQDWGYKVYNDSMCNAHAIYFIQWYKYWNNTKLTQASICPEYEVPFFFNGS